MNRTAVKSILFSFTGVILLLVWGCSSTSNTAQNPDESLAESAEQDSTVYLMVDQMPEMKGGRNAIYRVLRYPNEARQRRQQGRVYLHFIVTKEGRAREIEVSQSSGYPLLDRAAVDALRKVRFQPGKKEGQIVEVFQTIPVDFSLH